MALESNDSYRIGDADTNAQNQLLFSRASQFLSARDKTGLTSAAMKQHDELISRLNPVGASGTKLVRFIVQENSKNLASP